jgi:hypothetical protein
MEMDIGRALTFFTEDERWIEKTAIGTGVLLLSTLLSFVLVGVVGFFIVMGYGVRLLQNVRDGVNPILPEWDQWGDDLSRGFKLFVVQFIWALPILLIVVRRFCRAAGPVRHLHLVHRRHCLYVDSASGDNLLCGE